MGGFYFYFICLCLAYLSTKTIGGGKFGTIFIERCSLNNDLVEIARFRYVVNKGSHNYSHTKYVCKCVCVSGSLLTLWSVVACIQREAEATGVQGQGLTAPGL